jgi:hypothetical protein
MLHVLNDSTVLQVNVEPRMHISHVDVDISVLGKAFIDAGNELAMTFKGLSFSTVQSTVYKGQRWSSLDGYLRPTLGHHNLHVLLNTQVTKVAYTTTHTHNKYSTPLHINQSIH